ncbi:26S proteasome complex subunit [Fusarium irregulare]|uniref:26S proteasome complex subunit SEM1 n=1 Tax=Fusarium irregulare TaxID=2494466 RepID=A0A9W8PIS0_9HYPO|nr:26S proteasome complex subunit [Fusarium irregulare]
MASTDPKTTDDKPVEQKPEQKPAALGEDDEFEDFPVDDNQRDSDWPEDQTEAAKGSGETKHLWEESWDDDDTSDDFSQQLREELKKVEAKRR